MIKALFYYLFGRMKGIEEGTRHVVLEGDGYTFTDPNSDGNIVITEVGS